MELDIVGWVKRSTDEERAFRQAVHTILFAIASSEILSTKMFMKGGILLAIEFNSTRHTKDIDFSTDEKVGTFSEEVFITELSENLNSSVNELDYALDCRVQAHEMKPAREDATFPTLQLKIGFAYKGEKKHRLLRQGKCPTIVKIDYSFNEFNSEIDTLQLADDLTIKAYSLVDVVAEKYRAIIQQKDRRRTRRQDSYDLYFLFKNGRLQSNESKQKILSSLQTKAESRDVQISKDSLRDPEIIARSKKDYPSLSDEIKEELPPFETTYSVVREFYESLPW